MRALPPTGAHRRKHLAPTHHKQRRRRHGRPQREGRTDRRDLQRLRLHRRAAGRVHQRAPERHDRAQQGRDQQRRARQLLPEARQDRPRRHRSDRDRLDARGHEVLRPARARAADLEGRWLDWKEKGATDSEGNLIGYGTDIGPEGVCYRSDLFAAAGLPTDRDEVAKLLQGDWANYFKVGADYTAKTGKGSSRLRV